MNDNLMDFPRQTISADNIERMLELLVDMEMDLYKKGKLTLDDMWW